MGVLVPLALVMAAGFRGLPASALKEEVAPCSVLPLLDGGPAAEKDVS